MSELGSPVMFINNLVDSIVIHHSCPNLRLSPNPAAPSGESKALLAFIELDQSLPY